ncbi:hypothetical protein KC349_g4433 [Hortaea werneckii]|nr:hypothetical protein KC349_g4433 [Hortaea werneckii]
MADAAGPRRADYCAHAQSVTGCVACNFVNFYDSSVNGVNEHRRWSEAVREAEESLSYKGLDDTQRQAYTKAVETAYARLQACDDRLQQLYNEVESCRAEVDAICGNHPRESWAEVFQDLVRSNVEELDAVFRRAFPGDDAGKFLPEGHSKKRAFEGLDRSRIPATPDVLVGKGLGLQTYLTSARAMGPRVEGAPTPRLPTIAVGEQFVPTFMSTGRAYRMFGLPEDPGDDAPKTDEMAALSVDLQRCDLGASQLPPTAEARTERDYREQDERLATTTATMSEELQWKKLDRTKFLPYTEMLARQYSKLAVDKVTEKKSSNAEADNDDEATTVASSSPWPEAENPDFAGFTNWIAACQRADRKFGLVTLPKWAEDRKQREATLQEALTREPPFTDQDLNLGSPLQYYNGEPYLLTKLKQLKWFDKKR